MAFAYFGPINALSRNVFIFPPKEFAKIGDFFAVGPVEHAKGPGFDFYYACAWHLHILGRLTSYREFFLFSRPTEFAKIGNFFAVGPPENAKGRVFDFCYACAWH